MMGMQAGALEVIMFSNIARITKDMGDTKRIIGGAMKEVEGAVASAKSALASLGIGLGVGYFATLIKGSIDAVAHLEHFSKSTNISAEDLSGIRLLAMQSETDFDGLAKGINKMSVEIGKAPEKFAALGVTAKDNVGAFKQLADIFNSLPDIQQRNALAQAIFGKSWAEIAPALSEGSKKIGDIIERGKQLSGVTEENARQAKAFNDKWIELTGTGGFLTRLVMPILPLLTVLAYDMLGVSKKTEGMNDSFKPLLETLKTVVILGGNVAFVFKAMGEEIGADTAKFAALARGDLVGFEAIRQAQIENETKARADFDAWEKKIMGGGNSGKPTSGSQTSGGGDLGATAKAARFLDDGKRRLELLTAQYDSLSKLIERQREEDDIVQKGALADKLSNDSRQFEIGLIGMTTYEQQKLTATRQVDLQTRERIRAEVAKLPEDAMGGDLEKIVADAEKVGEAQKKGILESMQVRRDAERDWSTGTKIAFQDYIDSATNAAQQASMLFGNAFRNMEDALVKFAMTGKFEFRSFAESIIADLIRIQIRRAAAGIFANIGFAGLLSGGASASAGGAGMVGDFPAAVPVAHGGGVIGVDSFPMRSVPASTFTGAPRYHLGIDEVPAILQRGERVIPRGGSAGITINQVLNVGGNVTQADIPQILAAARQGAIAAMIDMKRREPNGLV